MDKPETISNENLANHDQKKIMRLAKALDCPPALVFETWLKLEMGSFEDPNELSNLNQAAKIYKSAVRTLGRLDKRLDDLPVEEIDRLIVEGNPVSEQVKAAALAFEELYA